MKRHTMSKTAGAIAIAMICSLLLPVLAFATSAFTGLPSSSSGSVSGVVYTDNFASVTKDVYNNPVSTVVNVNDGNGNSITTTTATYSFFDGTYYYFNINYDASVTFSTYNPITFSHDGTVSSAVYRQTSGGGGGGGFYIPPNVNGNVIHVPANGNVTANDLSQAFSASSDIVIHITDDAVKLPASVLAAQAASDPDSTITIVTDDATYTLPLSVFDFDQLAHDLTADLNDLSLVIGIKTLQGDSELAVENAATAVGAEVIAPVVEFTLKAEANGQSQSIDSFGDTYVKRTINVDQSADGLNETGVFYNPDSHSLSFVPSTFADENGTSVATLQRNSNSIYTVISNTKTFGDVAANSFAKADIDLLASKLIIAGVSDTAFEPNRNIKRSEFVALVVRALGLDTILAPASTFTDLRPGAWYVKEVATAEAAGLVAGYPDGTFHPDANITRQELASLVIRAVNFASQQDSELSPSEQASTLANFSDAVSIGDWARAELAAAVNAGIVFGYPNGTFAPANHATRAETAAMIERFLDNVGFIN